MKTRSYLFAVYASLLALGGVIGFLKASSLMSLYMGMASALTLFITSHFIYKGKRWALIASLILTFLLVCFFAVRFFKTGHFIPGGLMALLGSLLLVLNIFIRQAK